MIITRAVHLLDIEWLLSTLFDASLFRLRAAGYGGSFFVACSILGRRKCLFAVRSRPWDRVASRQLCATLCSVGAGQPSAAAQWFQSRQGLAQKQKRVCSVRRGRCPRSRST